jgi:hypothetical protein
MKQSEFVARRRDYVVVYWLDGLSQADSVSCPFGCSTVYDLRARSPFSSGDVEQWRTEMLSRLENQHPHHPATICTAHS